VTTHSFRKTVATLIDDEGPSARVGAEQLGHTHVSMTQARYMSRGGSIPRSPSSSIARSKNVDEHAEKIASEVGRAGLEPATNGL
jgi:integrase